MEKSLTKAQILESDDIFKEWVNVPEWGGGVYIRVMTGVERDGFENEVFIMPGPGQTPTVNTKNMRARLCARCICDEEGKKVFSTKDVKALGMKSGSALERVFSKAQILNRMRQKDIDKLVKNLPRGQNDSDGLSSPPDSNTNPSDTPNDQ